MKTRNIVMTGVFIAFGVVLPIAFHQFSMGGPAFLPMHIPVLLAGLTLGAVEGGVVGIITPIISSILTGMPPAFPMLPIMVFELMTYGLIAGLFSKRDKVNDYISLTVAMIGGRIMAGLVVFVLVTLFGFKGAEPYIFVKGAIITGIPGILIQFIFLPPISKLLKRVYKF